MDTNAIRLTMLHKLRYDAATYLGCGEVNSTLLAENVCDEMNAYQGENDEVIPEEFFEIASEVACEYHNDRLMASMY